MAGQRLCLKSHTYPRLTCASTNPPSGQKEPIKFAPLPSSWAVGPQALGHSVQVHNHSMPKPGPSGEFGYFCLPSAPMAFCSERANPSRSCLSLHTQDWRKLSNLWGQPLQVQLLETQIFFKVNPPGAPNCGGTWKQEIKSIKTALIVLFGYLTVTETVQRRWRWRES